MSVEQGWVYIHGVERGGETARLSVTDSSESDTVLVRLTNNNPPAGTAYPMRKVLAKLFTPTHPLTVDIIYAAGTAFFFFYFQFT